MMDKVKIGLLGVILVLVTYNIVQINQLKTEVKTTEENVLLKLNEFQNNAEKLNDAINKNSSSGVNTTSKQNQFTNKPVNDVTVDPNLANAQPKTMIKFDKELHDYGTILAGTDNDCSFTFTNTGSEPLTISNAKGSCGCTVPNWPKEPIMPGETGTIDVTVTPKEGQAGKPFEKVVTITANTNPVNTLLRVQANVVK